MRNLMMELQMDEREQKAVIEGLLFLWGEPLSTTDIGKTLNISSKKAKNLLEEMADEFDHERRGLQIQRFEDSYQLRTRRDHFDYFSQLVERKKPGKLSNSSMETLAIVAYKQPVTRVEVENIRGVKSSSSFDTLVKRGFIEECGRLDQIGRPIIYQTTDKFLQVFDLESIDDLPHTDEVDQLFMKAEEGEEDLQDNENQ